MSGSDAPPQVEPPRGWRRWLNLNLVGVGLLLFACGWSLVRVFTIRAEMNDPGVRTVRLCHWQLESGFRESLQKVMDEYNRLHEGEDIRIVQMAVPEKVYAQWLNVNLIADNAPDIAQMGQAKLANTGDSIAKYFLPLGREIMQPNPWNAPEHLDALEGELAQDEELKRRLATAPWRETLMDGMQGGYQAELQDYYKIPTSFFTIRLFYNKTLFAEALGSEAPPASLDELFSMCTRLREWAERKGMARFDPIAGTRYHRDMFVKAYRTPFTAGYRDALDLDLTGELSPLETWAGLQSGKVRMSDPAVRDYFLAVREICAQFNRNFTAMERDQATAAFAQGRAAMMASGSWDAGSVFHTAARWRIGVANFPLPAPDGRWGAYATAGGNEAGTTGGAAFGVVKSSPHADIALDFLRFLTSHKQNQAFNRGNKWMPITIGTLPHPEDPEMANFMPNPYGLQSGLLFDSGYDLQTKFNGCVDKFFGRELDMLDYDVFSAAITATLDDPDIGIDRIWFKNWQAQRDSVRSLEKTIAVHSFRELAGTGGEETADRIRQTVLDQCLINYGGNLRRMYGMVNPGRRLPEEK